MTLENEVLEVGGRRWKVREAVTREDALDAIASARCSGSVGARQTVDKSLCGGGVVVLADVVQINDDGTERQPYAAWKEKTA